MPYAAFISSNDIVGSLHNTNSTDEDLGFLSFVHLVGTCYFKKHIAVFTTNYGHTTLQFGGYFSTCITAT